MEWKNATHRPLNVEETVRRLREEETSTVSGSPEGRDAIRLDTVRVASVTRVEDDLSWGQIAVGNNDWRYWGVYDGHAGWATSTILRDYLARYVNRKINQLSAEELANPEAIEEAIKSAFVQLDDEIVSDALAAIYEPIPHAEAICRIAPAASGSCALLALYDPGSSRLHVAGTGDSRAVLGRRQPDDTKWAPIVLSVDHTGHNLDEVARIGAEHPGEEDDLFSRARRFLGSEVTRSFGDHVRKWPLKALQTWQHGFFGKVFYDDLPTPPYMTAAPDVKSIQVQPGDFLILATDGFWNHMSNEDAVYCMQMWIDAQKKDIVLNASSQVEHSDQSSKCTEAPDLLDGNSELVIDKTESPVNGPGPSFGGPEPPADKTELSIDGPESPVEPSFVDPELPLETAKMPVESAESGTPLHNGPEGVGSRPLYLYNWVMERESLMVERDLDNAATHLVRNAFGGKENNLFCSVMSSLSPESKQARDDVTVIVLFF